MKDSTAHIQAMADLLGVIEDAIEASGRFSRDDAVGSFRNCMTLFVTMTGVVDVTTGGNQWGGPTPSQVAASVAAALKNGDPVVTW